jgi:hypothetical protein
VTDEHDDKRLAQVKWEVIHASRRTGVFWKASGTETGRNLCVDLPSGETLR